MRTFDLVLVFSLAFIVFSVVKLSTGNHMVEQHKFIKSHHNKQGYDEEECGDGYTCTYDSDCNAYGCAPIANISNTVCCSAGQGTDNNCCGEGPVPKYFNKKLPFCPANGASGEGCVREANEKEEECGDGFTCIIDNRINAYGCAPISNTSNAVCCSAGMIEICTKPGEECGKWCVDCSHQDPCILKPGQVPYCPGGGATGDGCIRMLENMDEECGDGFRCTHDDHHFYGCAPIDNITNMVCCSQGQGCEEPGQECGKWCVDCSLPGPCNLKPGQLPYCPANGATEAGCVRMKQVLQEECGDGFTCVFDQRMEAYGCAPINNHTDTVCCSKGQGCEDPGAECGKWCVDCSTTTSCNLKPGQLPYCPANGATGEGCVRMDFDKE